MEPWNSDCGTGTWNTGTPWGPWTLQPWDSSNPAPEHWNLGALQCGNSGTLELWNLGVLELWALEPCNLEPWNPQTLESGLRNLERWNLGTLEPWSAGTLEPWNMEACELDRKVYFLYCKRVVQPDSRRTAAMTSALLASVVLWPSRFQTVCGPQLGSPGAFPFLLDVSPMSPFICLPPRCLCSGLRPLPFRASGLKFRNETGKPGNVEPGALEAWNARTLNSGTLEPCSSGALEHCGTLQNSWSWN